MRRVIVAGGRNFATHDKNNQRHKFLERDRAYAARCLYPLLTNFDDEYRMPHADLEIVSGGAKGADAVGEDFAIVHWVPLKVFKADWDKHGKAAGFIRNLQMAQNADALIAFWDGKSKGTKHMIETAHAARLECHIYYYYE